MSHPSHFGLFPPTVPRIALPNPHSKKPSLSRALVIAEHSPRPALPEAVVIQINGVVPQERDVHSRSSSADVEHATFPSSPIDGIRLHELQHVASTPPAYQQNFSRPTLTVLPNLLPAPPPRPMSATMANGQQGSAEPTSPVVPIRSIFPTYNPSLPLAKQSYHPQRTTSLPRQLYQRDEYRTRASTPSQLDDATGGLRTAPASIVDFPRDLPRAVKFSNARELPKLWEATNGQDPSVVHDSFDLQMARLNEATFTFGSDPAAPFYTMQTFDTNEISISRTNPSRITSSFDILLLSLEPASRRQPPHDGLVTYIFPKLAAMLAIDQSNELARVHQLAPTHRDEMQAAAVQRAANQEACCLYWREESNRYELEHPAICRDIRDPNFAISPTGAAPTQNPVLHITVSSHNLRSPMSTTYAPPVIYVTNPNAKVSYSSTPQSVHAGIRMSTLPQSDIDDPLCSLDMGTMTLHIAAKEILTLMPSLYAIDCIISAVLAVAVADEATNPTMATMDLWQPRPKAPMSQFGGSIKSYTGSTYYATLAERKEAEDEAKLMKQVHQNNRRGEGIEAEKKGWFAREKKVKKSKSKSIAVAEFDLEKLGHYQAGERKGEELPGITRTLLAAVIWALQCLVWLLTTSVKLLVWILVNVSRALTSEKF